MYELLSTGAAVPQIITGIHILFYFIFFTHIYFPAPGQAVVTGVVLSSPRFLPSIAHRLQQSHCSSIFHRGLLTHALALSASQFVRKKKSPRICMSTLSGGFELTKLTNTRLEDKVTYNHPRASGDPSLGEYVDEENSDGLPT